MDRIPRNAISKALRREMPKQLASQLAPESRGPSTPMEQVLLAIWHKVLRRDDIGVTDNVFEFGADPLRAEMASGLIDEASGVRMSIKVLYSKPTVREQAAYCPAQREQPVSQYCADCLSRWRRTSGSPQRPKSSATLSLGGKPASWFSAIVRGDNEPIVKEVWFEGEAVRVIKEAWRSGYQGMAVLLAVAWDSQLSPVDLATCA